MSDAAWTAVYGPPGVPQVSELRVSDETVSVTRDRGLVWCRGAVPLLTGAYLAEYVGAARTARELVTRLPVWDVSLPTPLLLPAVTGLAFPEIMPVERLLASAVAVIRAQETTCGVEWLTPQAEETLASFEALDGLLYTVRLVSTLVGYGLAGLGVAVDGCTLGLPEKGDAVGARAVTGDRPQWVAGLLARVV